MFAAIAMKSKNKTDAATSGMRSFECMCITSIRSLCRSRADETLLLREWRREYNMAISAAETLRRLLP